GVSRHRQAQLPGGTGALSQGRGQPAHRRRGRRAGRVAAVSDGDYQSTVVATGVRRLKLLSRSGEVLMRAYSGGAIDDTDFTDWALRQLLGARVLWRDDEDGRRRISHKLRELIAEMIAAEQRRQTHADVAESLDTLRAQANRYLD